jgi:hypothetical protein
LKTIKPEKMTTGCAGYDKTEKENDRLMILHGEAA